MFTTAPFFGGCRRLDANLFLPNENKIEKLFPDGNILSVTIQRRSASQLSRTVKSRWVDNARYVVLAALGIRIFSKRLRSFRQGVLQKQGRMIYLHLRGYAPHRPVLDSLDRAAQQLGDLRRSAKLCNHFLIV